jgi:GPH family glycoside/pentoside/hexuronide:cation symporter
MKTAPPAIDASAAAIADDRPQPIPFRVRFSWGLGSLGTIGYLNTVTSLVLVYLTTVMKIDPGLAGAMVFTARIVDAFSDPLMGWVTDRTRSRWGRRRPWLLLGAFVCGLGLPLVYSQHAFGVENGAAMVALAVLIFYSIGFTIFNVPYLTMPVEMTTDRLQRLDLMSYRSVFMMFGSVAGSAGAPLLVEKLGRNADAYQALGVVAGIVVFALMLTTFLGTSGARANDAPMGRVPIREQLQAVLDNRPFMMMVGIKVFQFVALSAAGATTAFFVVMVLKRDFSLMSLLAIATIASTLTFIPFFRWVGRHVTKRTGLAIGIVGEIFATLTWVFATPEDSEMFFVARGVLAGIFSSAILLFSQAMWLDTIDYDRERSGLRREGLYTSLYVFIERLGYSMGPLLLGELLQAMDFDKNLPLEQQPASAELAVSLSLIGIPCIGYGLGLVFLWFYRLPERVGGTARV